MDTPSRTPGYHGKSGRGQCVPTTAMVAVVHVSKTNSPLLPNETAEGVLCAFGIRLTGSIRTWQAGKRKTVFQVESNRGPVGVIRSIPGMTPRFALQVQEYVYSRANLAPQVFRTRKNDFLYSFQGAQYTVCRWVSGRHLHL